MNELKYLVIQNKKNKNKIKTKRDKNKKENDTWDGIPTLNPYSCCTNQARTSLGSFENKLKGLTSIVAKTNATMMNVPPEKKRDVHGADCDSYIRTIVVVRASTLDTPKH